MMDEDDINGLIQRCQKLKHKFRGVFAADNFPSKLKSNTFLILNASKSQNLKILARTGSSFVKRTTIFCLLLPLDDPCLLTRIFINDLQKIMYSFTNYLKTNQFKVKTQNCVDSFVFLLLI